MYPEFISKIHARTRAEFRQTEENQVKKEFHLEGVNSLLPSSKRAYQDN